MARAPPVGRPTPRDTTLDALGDGLQNPRIALDPTGGLHVAYERAVASGQQVRYKRWTPKLGWDHRATEVSDPSDHNASSIELMPTSTGNLTVSWIGFDGTRRYLRERARFLDGTALADAPAPNSLTHVSLAAGRNPLRAGNPLEFSGAALAAGIVVDLLDAAGRQVARATADHAGLVRFGAETTRSLAAGLYFASVRGSEARGRVVVLH